MIILISRHSPNYVMSNMHNPLFAFCLPHTMRISLIVKQALLTSGYNLESRTFPTTFIPSKRVSTNSLFYISLSLFITCLVSCQVTSPTYTETILALFLCPPLLPSKPCPVFPRKSPLHSN